MYRSQLLSNSGSSADHREFSRFVHYRIAPNCTYTVIVFEDSLDKILKELEREHSISVRWSPLDKEYART